MALTGALQACVDRPEFWTGLGVKAPPALLARLGRALCAYATGDADAERAMLSAAADLQPPGQIEQSFAPLHRILGDTPPVGFPPLFVSATWAQESQGEDCSTSEDEEETTSLAAARSEHMSQTAVAFLKRYLACFAPAVERSALGACVCQVLLVLWCVVSLAMALCIGCVPQVLESLYQRTLSKGIPVLVFRLDNFIFRPGLLTLCLPMIQGIRRLFHSRAMLGALHRELSNPSGSELARVARTVFAGICILKSGLYCSRIILDSRTLSTAALFQLDLLMWPPLLITHILFLFAFFVLWMVTWGEVRRFGMRFETGEHVVNWVTLTREHQGLRYLLQDLWRLFGSAVLAYLGASLIGLVRCIMFFMSVTNSWWVVYHFVWAVFHGAMIILSLYMMAKMTAKCQSKSFGSGSVLVLASRYFGRVPKDQVWQHSLFVQYLTSCSCGVEIPPMGTITKHVVIAYIRVFTTVLPICLGLAFKRNVRGF